jgi:hypothetical protein
VTDTVFLDGVLRGVVYYAYDEGGA